MGTYTVKVYQSIPSLQSLDGHRKAVNAIDFNNAIPPEPEDDTPYTADQVAWYNDEVYEDRPAKNLFEDSTNMKREES